MAGGESAGASFNAFVCEAHSSADCAKACCRGVCEAREKLAVRMSGPLRRWMAQGQA